MSSRSISARGSAGLPVAVNSSGRFAVSLRSCDAADAEHAANRRQYAHTFHYPETICVADAFWQLPAKHRDGIILHEFGHLVAGPHASEREADEAAEEMTGGSIGYVDSRYGNRLETSAGVINPELYFDPAAGVGTARLNLSPEQWDRKEAAVREWFYTERGKLEKAYGGLGSLRRHVERLEAERDRKLSRVERARAGAREAYETPLFERLNVTDRALRYRANEQPPEGPRVCVYCGSVRFIEIDHVDGFEDDSSPENLVWACRRCNTLKGI